MHAGLVPGPVLDQAVEHEQRPDLTDADVAHLLWTMNSPSFYRLATRGGRGPADYAAMVLDLWTRTLLA